MSIRVCRFCRQKLSMQATVCPSCQKETLPPKRFATILATMLVLLAIACGGVVYGAYSYYEASKLYYCTQQFQVPTQSAGIVCEGVCQSECVARGGVTGESLLWGRDFCLCQCGGCFEQKHS